MDDAQHLVALIREQVGLPDLPLHLGRLRAGGEPVTWPGRPPQEAGPRTSCTPSSAGTQARTGTTLAASWGSG